MSGPSARNPLDEAGLSLARAHLVEPTQPAPSVLRPLAAALVAALAALSTAWAVILGPSALDASRRSAPVSVSLGTGAVASAEPDRATSGLGSL